MSVHIARFDTVPAQARPFHGRPAGLITRLLANTIDLLVVTVLVVAVYAGLCGVLFLRRGASFTFPTVTHAQAYWAWFGVLIVYFAWGWTTSGRTYGDRLLGLRVRRRDGGGVGLWRGLIRALLCAGFPFLLLWVAVDRDRRSVQDLLVGTHVVYDWGGSLARASDDPVGMAVDVAPPVADEADDGDAQPVPDRDGE
jgi:uncharacterized RDD family membrane protein YckC